MGSIEAAAELLETTFSLAVDNDLYALEADILFEQGLLEKSRGHVDLAVAKLDAAANLYKQIGVDRGFREVVRTLNELQRKRNG